MRACLRSALRFFLPLLILCTLCCTSSPYKKQSYAKLSNEKVFEEEFVKVWKGIVSATSEYTITEKDEQAGVLVTDWIYSTSSDKFIEYKVDSFPRKKYLQTRYRFKVLTSKQIGGVKVTVNSSEEVEKIKESGDFDRWLSVSDPDSARQNEILKAIELKILSN